MRADGVDRQILVAQQRPGGNRPVVYHLHRATAVPIVDIKEAGFGLRKQDAFLSTKSGVSQVDLADLVFRMNIEPPLGRV